MYSGFVGVFVSYQASELIYPALRNMSVVFILCWHHKDNKLLSI